MRKGKRAIYPGVFPRQTLHKRRGKVVAFSDATAGASRVRSGFNLQLWHTCGIMKTRLPRSLFLSFVNSISVHIQTSTILLVNGFVPPPPTHSPHPTRLLTFTFADDILVMPSRLTSAMTRLHRKNFVPILAVLWMFGSAFAHHSQQLIMYVCFMSTRTCSWLSRDPKLGSFEPEAEGMNAARASPRHSTPDPPPTRDRHSAKLCSPV